MDRTHLSQGTQELPARCQLGDELLTGDAVRNGFDERSERLPEPACVGGSGRGKKNVERQLSESAGHGEPDTSTGVIGGISNDDVRFHEGFRVWPGGG